MLPQALLLSGLWFVIMIVYGLLAGGSNSPFLYYCLGLASFLPLYGLTLVLITMRRWPLNDAIINWDRVESLIKESERKA